ncbi:hypothetical protein, partial [Streptomyces sp. NPDC058855]|uniref:hypothetical protein n=1 Tax=Streptomyces sp. NPDC058855 TaxID=3346651 RepID=UPI00369B0CEC
IDGWVRSIVSAFEEPSEKADAKTKARYRAAMRKAREHRLVPELIPAYVERLDTAEARVAQLDAEIKAGSPPKKTSKASEEDDGDEEELDLSRSRSSYGKHDSNLRFSRHRSLPSWRRPLRN